MISKSVSNFLCCLKMTRDYKIIAKQTGNPHFYFHSPLLTQTITCSVRNQWLRENNPPCLSRQCESKSGKLFHSPRCEKKVYIICFQTDVVTPQFNVSLPFSSGKGSEEKLAIAAEGVERNGGRYRRYRASGLLIQSSLVWLMRVRHNLSCNNKFPGVVKHPLPPHTPPPRSVFYIFLSASIKSVPFFFFFQ